MKLIPLSKGQFVKVSDHRFNELTKWKWFASRKNNAFYAGRNSPKKHGKHLGPPIWMHRFILGLQAGDQREADHINHDTLDCRDENLRIVDKRHNAFNQKLRKDNRAKHKGISFRRDTKKWRAYSFDNNRQVNLGCFASRDEAIKVYRAYALATRGEFASF